LQALLRIRQTEGGCDATTARSRRLSHELIEVEVTVSTLAPTFRGPHWLSAQHPIIACANPAGNIASLGSVNEH